MKQTSAFLRYVLVSLVFVGCTGTVGPEGVRRDPSASGGSAGGGEGGSGGTPTLPVASCTDRAVSVGAGRWRRLTMPQYRNAVRDLLGIEADTSAFLADGKTGTFATNAVLPPQANHIEHYRVSAEKAAIEATGPTRLATLLGCDARGNGEDACANQFITAFGSRAYRRPLTTAEVATLKSQYALGKEDSFAAGIGLVVETVLQSPNFLYLPELGIDDEMGVFRLSGSEVAARLSFLLWDSLPDSELTNAATAGDLDRPDGIATQAERMMKGSRFLSVASSFHAQLLGIDGIRRPGSITKNAALFPEFTADLREAMANETDRFVAHIFASGDGSIESLLTAPLSFPTGPLVKLYGLNAASVPVDGRYENRDGTRVGLLTQASFLTAHPGSQSLFPAVARGKEIRVNFLCGELPAPPAEANFEPPPNADKLTQQELMRQHQDDPTCKPCHALMEPIGFGLDTYDAIGRYRTTAPDGTTVNASGDIVGSDVEGVFVGAKDLSSRLGRSQDVRTCMASQWFEYTLGREPGEADNCSVSKLADILKEGGGDIRRGLMAFVTSDAFRFRKGE